MSILKKVVITILSTLTLLVVEYLDCSCPGCGLGHGDGDGRHDDDGDQEERLHPRRDPHLGGQMKQHYHDGTRSVNNVYYLSLGLNPD